MTKRLDDETILKYLKAALSDVKAFCENPADFSPAEFFEDVEVLLDDVVKEMEVRNYPNGDEDYWDEGFDEAYYGKIDS